MCDNIINILNEDNSVEITEDSIDINVEHAEVVINISEGDISINLSEEVTVLEFEGGVEGGGDMKKSVYDPTNVEADIFDANNINVDTTNFNNNLSPSDNKVQKALDTLDDLVTIQSSFGNTFLLMGA